MPSASAKTEKTALLEAADPVKQLSITLEKKVRNLEKRKLKLDNYKNDVQNGKELNEDQKLAVSKYDQVIEVLEYSKDLYKSLNAISQESVRLQKKIAKKEQIERQQREIQRLQEAFYYRHILSSLENEEVRRDFLTGENGASKLSEDDLHHLDQFYKLIAPELPNDQADIEGHFHALAENMIFLVDGKNKDIAGTTYKALKELLRGMKESGYFSRTSETAEEVSSDEVAESLEELEKHVPTEEIITNSTEVYEQSPISVCADEEIPKEQMEINGDLSDIDISKTSMNPEANVYTIQNGSLQDVLASQGSFNFLQESQIELDTPHMDPAVVAVHQMAPPPTAINYPVPSYQVPPGIDKMHETSIPNGIGIESNEVSPPPSQMATIPVMGNAVPRSISSVLTSVQHNGSPDFDPSHPIPTQTFTNQSFAIMQNIMVPTGAYVPVTMHHSHLPPHMAPIAVVPGLSPPITSPTNSIPMHITGNSAPAISETQPVMANPEMMSPKENELESQTIVENGSCSGPETGSPQNGIVSERSHEGFVPSYQRNRGRGGRGRGLSNSYYRGRGNYNNGRGGYQSYNNYSTGWNPRRGGPSRGRGNGGIRTRGNFHNRSTQEQQQQQQQIVNNP